MSPEEPRSISITLTPVQIDEVVRAASSSRAPSLATLIVESLGAPRAETAPTHGGSAHGGSQAVHNGSAPAHSRPEALQNGSAPAREGAQAAPDPRGSYMPSDTSDPRLSRSLLRGLAILTRFGPAGESRGIVELAADLDMSPSTAHRYAQTLIELGLLERCPNSRKYRLPSTPA